MHDILRAPIPEGLQKRIDAKLERQQGTTKHGIFFVRRDDDIETIRRHTQNQLHITQPRIRVDEFTGITNRLRKILDKNEADNLRLRPGDRMRLAPNGARLEIVLRQMIGEKRYIDIEGKYVADEALEGIVLACLPNGTEEERKDLLNMIRDLNVIQRPLQEDLLQTFFEASENSRAVNAQPDEDRQGGYDVVPLQENEWNTKIISADAQIMMGIWGKTNENGPAATFIVAGREAPFSQTINIPYLQTDLGAEKIAVFILQKKAAQRADAVPKKPTDTSEVGFTIPLQSAVSIQY